MLQMLDNINETIGLLYSFLNKGRPCRWHCGLRAVSASVPEAVSEPAFLWAVRALSPSLQWLRLMPPVCKAYVFTFLSLDSEPSVGALWLFLVYVPCPSNAFLVCSSTNWPGQINKVKDKMLLHHKSLYPCSLGHQCVAVTDRMFEGTSL